MVGNKQKMFLPHPHVKVSIVGSLHDREVACRPQTARARISNHASGGQCHLNHLTILRRFSWPSLVYMCTNRGLKPHSFHFILRKGNLSHYYFHIAGLLRGQNQPVDQVTTTALLKYGHKCTWPLCDFCFHMDVQDFVSDHWEMNNRALSWYCNP